jgi:hypothetical protein
MSKDDATNAWLWLIKGDGDLDQKAWLAMVASDLLKSDADACDAIEGVCKSGAKVTTNAVVSGLTVGGSLLHTAVLNNKPAVVKCLLGAKAEAGFVDADGRSLLSKATGARVARLLVEHGADIYAVDDRGKVTTALDYEQSNSREVWSYLRAVQLSRSSMDAETETQKTDDRGNGDEAKTIDVDSDGFDDLFPSINRMEGLL